MRIYPGRFISKVTKQVEMVQVAHVTHWIISCDASSIHVVEDLGAVRNSAISSYWLFGVMGMMEHSSGLFP